MNFQTQHLATLAKYAGISFIAGAVNHGMFSEQRSLLTAAIVGFHLSTRKEIGESYPIAMRAQGLATLGALAALATAPQVSSVLFGLTSV